MSMKKPPSKPDNDESKQFELFSNFIANPSNVEDMSNIAQTWEAVPKYFPARKMNELRNKDGLSGSFTHEYKENGEVRKIKIQPALIEQPDGSELACFPSGTEELIEEVLKKILVDQRYGLHVQNQKPETWVRFSLSMIERELRQRGKTRNRNEIKRSIQVLSKTNYTLYAGNKEVWNGSILQDLLTVDRSDFLQNPDELHAARLPIFISKDIENLDYRQFNYGRLMRIERQLTRWIYKLLIERYSYANTENTYHFMFSNLKKSGLLQKNRERDNRKDVEQALNELVKTEVISDNYQAVPKKEGRSIVDVKYLVTATPKFTVEQKAANKRNSDNRKSLTGDQVGHNYLDNVKKIAGIKPK